MPNKRKGRGRSAHDAVIEQRQRRRTESMDSALGWRIDEWCALTGTSRPTVWKHKRNGKLKIIYLGAIPFVPRTEAVRLGFISE